MCLFFFILFFSNYLYENLHFYLCVVALLIFTHSLSVTNIAL
jgi:hypothetical protein